MSQIWGKTNKICATCEYWLGKRELISGNSQVKVGSAIDKGKCINGGFKGVDKQGGSSCGDFKKWSLVK